MSATELLDKTLLENALNWFQPYFRLELVGPIEGLFPNCLLPHDIRTVLDKTERTLTSIGTWPGERMASSQVGELLSGDPRIDLPLLKQIIILYRRHRAAYTETRTEKTFHLELTETLERDVKTLDTLVNSEWFAKIDSLRLPRLKDFLPVQLIEAAVAHQTTLLPRQYDQKFAILQTPGLFLPDLAFLRAKCEARGVFLIVAFLDIDHFKELNKVYTETKVDRNLLPLFLQAVEAHVYHHGYAYQEGGDELMILIPSFSRSLAIGFLEELRVKLAGLQYPDIKEKTTVSIGLCIVEPDSPLTDRELRDSASQAKRFAKENGRNCIATYKGNSFVQQELEVIRQNA